jgi:hypothetical protein
MNTQRMGRTGHLVYETEFKLDRDHLLTVWNKWKPVIKKGLEKQPPQFDLLPLLDEEMNWLRELCCGVFALREAKITACLEYLSEQLRRIQTPPNAVPVLWLGESMPNGPPPSVDILPLEQVRRMAKILAGGRTRRPRGGPDATGCHSPDHRAPPWRDVVTPDLNGDCERRRQPVTCWGQKRSRLPDSWMTHIRTERNADH